MNKRGAAAVVGTAAVAGAIAWWIASQSPTATGAPSTSTTIGSSAGRDVPSALPRRTAVGSPEYAQVAEADPLAGAKAFRAYTDDYIDGIPDQVADHVTKERLTLDEVRELTYFALAAKTSIDWDAVEQVTGHGIDPNARKYATQEMFKASEEMARELRAHVAADDPVDDRWDTIRRIEQQYLDEYYRLTGMTPQMLDWLLWEFAQDPPATPESDDDVPNGVPGQPGGGLPDGVQVVDRHLNDLIPPP